MDRRKFCKTTLAASIAATFPLLTACGDKTPVATEANTSIKGITLDGAEIELEKAAIKELGNALSGPVMLSGHPDYDGARLCNLGPGAGRHDGRERNSSARVHRFNPLVALSINLSRRASSSAVRSSVL